MWTLLGFYFLLMVAISLPWIQERVSNLAAEFLSEKLGTEVKIGNMDLGFLNRLILDDVLIYDHQGKEMLKVSRLTAKIELTSLAIGHIVIPSAQLFGAQLKLYKATADSQANYQFVLDSLAGKDSVTAHPMNLRINSLIIRQGQVSYDQWDIVPTPQRLNPHHLNISNISAHILLKALTHDSLNVNIKRITCKEQSGLNVNRLSLHLMAGRHQSTLTDFKLQMPHTDLRMNKVTATYDLQRIKESLNVKGAIKESYIAPFDLRALITPFKDYESKLTVSTQFHYRNQTLLLPLLNISSSDEMLSLQASGYYRNSSEKSPSIWNTHVERLKVKKELTDFVSKHFIQFPNVLQRLGDIQLAGNFSNSVQSTLRANAEVSTAVGQLQAKGTLDKKKRFTIDVKTKDLNIGRLLEVKKLGTVATELQLTGMINERIAAKGHVSQLEYDGYTYSNINVDGNYAAEQLAGQLQVNDPRVTAQLEVDLKGKNINSAIGFMTLSNLSLPEKDYYLKFLKLESTIKGEQHFLMLNSDFGHAVVEGKFNYSTLMQSVEGAVGARLPTLPGLPTNKGISGNNFRLNATVVSTDWLQKLLNVKLEVNQPVTLQAMVNDHTKKMMVNLLAPDFTINETRYQQGVLHISTPRDTMFVEASISKPQEKGNQLEVSLSGNAANNNLQLALTWNNNSKSTPFSGQLNATSHLYRNFYDQAEAHVSILPSNIIIDNSTWQIEPSDILYSTERLLVDHFEVRNGQQSIKVDGTASKEKNDSLAATLTNIDVGYVLDLVDFDAVSFDGQASGRAVISSVMNNPDATAYLRVNNFLFQDGRMGVLNANVNWNKSQEQIDLKATANDGAEAITYIDGYVAPLASAHHKQPYINLNIAARGTYLDFMHSFTKSFVSHITGHGTGNLRLAGPLDAINLTGGLVVDAEATLTPLNTTYTLKHDTLTMVYNEIRLDNVPIHDKYGNVGYVTGGIHHQDLTNLSLDLHIDTDRLLSYDFHEFGNRSFYGTVFAAGEVDISMKNDDVHINCNVTPLKNTVFIYNAANPDAISTQEFVTWKGGKAALKSAETPLTGQETASSDNIYMTFLINATPDATMRLLMDSKTGDYITLNGNGSIQATYYNKGAFQMFGTYTVSSGTYDVTIQNIINKRFQFQPEGTITFGGDPYAAALNLQAVYAVNGVSLSDLELGNSFSSNTVRVNCLMNIGGQPQAPQVTFDLDLPTVNADEKQMVRSLLSSQQEMNQQVLYLLGIGRFYNNRTQNNINDQQVGQTQLAMQSFLSGTLSTQINSVLNQMLKNDDWNFGANISTGTEGWNNAEYEGIVNGRMLNNRLLINGQFGYRDNATQAAPSFIGDFDVRYLLTPSGNIALKVYNQTNDRYFTRSSLNTQGLGIIMKKDFGSLRDLFKARTSKERKRKK